MRLVTRSDFDGVACAMMLPIVMEYNAETTGEKYKNIAEAMGVDTTGMCAPSFTSTERSILSPSMDGGTSA